jgi:23S rRNA pseudouridine2604 synthase
MELRKQEYMENKPDREAIPFPVRINRYLALKGIATRRAAEKFIEEGKVIINGRKAVLTDRVQEDDVVTVKSIPKRTYRYFAYHKPRGILTHSPQSKTERAIADVINIQGIFPIGRLDKDSEGLLILTDDGRVTDRLLSPRFDHEKEYVATIQERVRPDMIARLAAGPDLEDGPSKPCQAFSHGAHRVTVILTEGRKHQVRRMLSAVGGTVTELERIRVMNIELGSLSPGEYRAITGTEKEEFLSALGLR